MHFPILIAGVLVTLTVLVHATGFALLLRALMKSHAAPRTQTWPIVWLLISVTWWLILIHVTEITLWSLFYFWSGCLPDAESAFYFSGATYTTIGYGDVVLPKPWRILGPHRGVDRHSHVRIVRRPFLRGGQPDLRVPSGGKEEMIQ